MLFISILLSYFLVWIGQVEGIWIPAQGLTWNYVLGSNIDETTETAKVVDIDIRKSVDKIKKLHNKGIKVICYFSGGTLEDFRDDYDDFMAVKGLVKNTYEAWPEERWLDIRVEGLKPLLKKRMKLAVSKNCDGIEVDNLDGYQMKEVKSWSKPLTKQDTIKFAKWLAETAHSLGLSIGLKNVPDIIDELSSYYDYAINEDCAKYNECHRYQNFLKLGKAVFGITYNGLDNNLNALCKNLNGLGISMIVKNKKLVQSGITFNGKKYCGSNFNANIKTCFSNSLGYPCCASKKIGVSFIDNHGKWGIENGSWCGLAVASTNNKSTCFSAALGYPCCSKTTDVYYTDNNGQWGIENGNWCGIDIPTTNASKSCFSVALGYSCCSKNAKVYFTDKNGKWGIENGNWCGIN